MKNFALLFFGIISATFFGQKSIISDANLQSVTLYEQSAELSSTATVKIPKGSSEIILTNIAERIDESSIKIGSADKISVLTCRFTTDNEVFDAPLDLQNPDHRKVKDSLDLVRNKIRTLEAEQNALQRSIDILDKNQTVNAGSKRFANEVEKMVNLTLKKRTELSLALDKKSSEIQKFTEKENKLKKRFDRNQLENVADGKIVLQVTAQEAETVNFNIKYTVQNAGWRPFYEISSKGIGEKIHLAYKAVISQSTGLDWKNVKLNLVSGFPNRTKIAPQIQPWEIYYQEQIPIAYGIKKEEKNYASADEISEKKLTSASVSVTEVRNSAFKNQLNVGYDLADKYSILSNSKDHSIDLETKEIPATYTYFAIPKYDRTAYLTAEIENLDKYNLVTADANVVFENTNVGKTVLNSDSENGKMRITFGDDRRISLKRELIKDENSQKNISATNREQQFAYEITARNNRSEKINITLQDHVPISTDKQIIISVTEKGSANYDAKTGILTWKLNIGANETAKVKFGYKVNYLKNKVLIGL